MAYHLLQTPKKDSQLLSPSAQVSHRPRIRTHESAETAHCSAVDEHPLLTLSSFSKPFSNRDDSVPYLVNVGELDYDSGSMFEIDNEFIGINSHGKSVRFSSPKTRFRAFSRYIRSSGPAKTPTQANDTTVTRSSRMPTGWRLGTWVCCSAIILCIIVEAALLIYATKTSDGRGPGILMEGNCKDVRSTELWLLLPLNIAGTILIGTSNYVMQVVCAPSRKEIDDAHAHAQSIAVGGVRFNDMAPRKGNKLRRSIWWALGTSSVPIHFLLNVAFYSSVQASNTGVLVVSNDFATDKGWDYCENLPSDAAPKEAVTCSLYHNYMNGLTVAMTTSQCLQQYSNGFQTNASSVIVVTSQESQRWYTIPLTAEVPDSVSYGMHCFHNDTFCEGYSDWNSSSYSPSCPTGIYTETSINLYNFTQNVTGSSTTVSLEFTPFCQNYTNYTKDGRYLNSEILPTARSSTVLNLTSFDDLSLQEDDAIANITSVKALFSAFQYRYWAVASASGDYLNPSYTILLDNRDPRIWLCPRSDLAENEQCDVTDLQRSGAEWTITPNSLPVQECHVLPKKELCTLQYSRSILIITMCFDVVKLSAMVAAICMATKPLMTLGDIIQSFLRFPDQYTESRAILDDDIAQYWTSVAMRKIRDQAGKYLEQRFGNDFGIWTKCKYCGKRLHSNLTVLGFDANFAHRECGKYSTASYNASELQEQAFTWFVSDGGAWWTTVSTDVDRLEPKISQRTRWFQVPSLSRWTWFVFFYIPALSLTIAYFSINYRSLLEQRVLKPWTVGFDAPDPNSLLIGGLAGTSSIYGAAVLVNGPQIAFSLLYFIFNATLTMMHTAHEWASFAVHRKALRVSSPHGQQRSTYWLQLPWTYSIPLIVISGSMHWLLSRSLYIVKVDVYGYLGEREADKDYFACGYSPIPALLLLFVLASMGLMLCGLGFRRLPSGMPLVRLNSLAIAAACHTDPDEDGLELRPLMWGELENYSKNGKPRCSFSAKPVTLCRENLESVEEFVVPKEGVLFNPKRYRARVLRRKSRDIS